VVIVVILVLLIIEIGWAAVAGVVVMFTILPVQGVVAKKIGLKRSEMLKSTDERVKTITEILTGIRVVKFYAWEEPFADRVQKTRVKEVASLRSFVLLKMFNLTVCAAFQPTACRLHLLEHDGVVVCLGVIVQVFFVWPVVTSLAMFGVYAALGSDVTVTVVFTVLSFVNTLRFPLALFPMALGAVMLIRLSPNSLCSCLIYAWH